MIPQIHHTGSTRRNVLLILIVVIIAVGLVIACAEVIP